jgi:hypothetical protein
VEKANNTNIPGTQTELLRNKILVQDVICVVHQVMFLHHLTPNIIMTTISPLPVIMCHLSTTQFITAQNISQKLIVRSEFLTAVAMKYIVF